MTRRKKTKSATNRNAASETAALANNATGSSATNNSKVNESSSGSCPLYAPSNPHLAYSTSGPRPVYASTGPRPVYATSGPRPVYASTGPRPVYTPSGPHPVYASTGPRPVNASSGPQPVYVSPTSSNPSSGTLTSLASTSTSDPTEKTLNQSKQKKPTIVTVRYETKEIFIQSAYPILTVTRLNNLDYHVGVLTEALGKKPRVYQHGKGVRFVPDSSDEYNTLQRYLARIESQEKIAWCSHTLSPGNSLKVNIKVRVVERVKLADDLKKLNLDKNEKSKDTDPAQKDEQLTIENSKEKDNTKNLPPKDKAPASEQNDNKKPNNTNKQKQLSTSKPQPKDIRQRRDMKKRI